MKRQSAFAGFLVLVVLLLAGCGGLDESEKDDCQTNDDCLTGYFCNQQGKCVEDGGCTPHEGTYCKNGVNYGVDSCGNLEKVIEHCNFGCTADHTGCRSCPTGQVMCGDQCVDWLTNDDHCGACSNACGPQADCVNGACSCVAGFNACSGKCVNLDSDSGNCGACGNECAFGNCVGGHCCEKNDDCPDGYWCDRTVWECKKIECIPNCTGKCCGDDGCDGTCPDTCPSGYTCNQDTCQCEST